MLGARNYVLNTVFDGVAQRMELRLPQRESLRAVHGIFETLPPIADRSPEDIARRISQLHPNWSFPEGYAALTFALATGVGKTRLMGAIMAYLYNAGESQNFVLLAPRDTILRKLEAECREASDKYIFVEPSLVPQPRICHRGNLEDFDPRRSDDGFLPTGPNVFVLSPQILLVSEGRIGRVSERTGISILDYLRSCEDLVVFADESHHLTPSERSATSRSFGDAVRRLEPKVLFAMTATPRPEANVVYEYGLARCLRERHYTKAIRLIVDEEASTRLSSAEYDRFTLDYAVARTRAKREALEELRAGMPAFPPIEPILLVSAANIEHAREVGNWLIEERRFSSEEVLVITSQNKTEEDLQRLAAIERSGSRVRIVVQVHVLDEGWDVTNVYAIAPLRNVRSYTNARQVMGRGLRLPLGYRTGDTEVDTLDVLAFGQDTFQDIYDQVTRDFGDPASVGGGVEIVDRSNGTAASHGTDVIADDEGDGPDMKAVVVDVSRPVSVSIPVLDMIPPEPDLDVSPPRLRGGHGGRTVIDLGSVSTSTVFGDVRFERNRFVSLASERVLMDFDALSAPLHEHRIRQMVETCLDEAGFGAGEVTGLDPVLVAAIIMERLQAHNVELPPTYASLGRRDVVAFLPYSANVPVSYVAPLDARTTVWNGSVHRRVPFGGWQRCVHEAARFDSEPEFEMARRLDRMGEVDWWLRNDPAQLPLRTMAGGTGVDFVVGLKPDAGGGLILLEVKGEHLWEPRRSDSWIRARDVRLWADEANRAGVPRIKTSVILGADVSTVQSLEDLSRYDALSSES